MGKLLSDRTAERLVHLLNATGGAPATRRGGGATARWVVVRCTSATAVGGDAVRNQCYPAVILEAACNATAPLGELADCLLTVLGASGNAVAPTAGRCYAGVLTGDVASDGAARPRVFAAEAETGASGPDSWKQPVRAATTAALPTNTYANGTSGVGATLTGSANGALAAQDGVTLTANQDLLVKDEASGLKNGIYTLIQVGDGSHPYILTRRADCDTAAEFPGAAVVVMEGTTNADTGWLCTTNATITVGATAVAWTKVFPAPSSITTSLTLLTANNNITADNAWHDTTLSITLPSAGEYLIFGRVTITSRVSALVFGAADTAIRLAASGTEIAGSGCLTAMCNTVGVSDSRTVSFCVPYTAGGSGALTIQGKANSTAGTFDVFAILGTGGGVGSGCSLVYQKLS